MTGVHAFLRTIIPLNFARLRNHCKQTRIVGTAALRCMHEYAGAAEKSKSDKRAKKEEKRRKSQEERRKIIKEITQGYFKDFKDFKDHGGKLFLADEKPLPKELSKTFPSMECINMSGTTVQVPSAWSGNVTLVLASLRALGQQMGTLYRVPFIEEFGATKGVLCCEMNMMELWIYKFLQRQILSNLQKVITSEQQRKNYYCHFGSCTDFKKAHVHNIYVSHAYLLDKQGYIRWSAHGKPTNKELESMKKCTVELLR